MEHARGEHRRPEVASAVQLRVCRQLQTAPCQTIATVPAAPGKPAQYIDALPATLSVGPPQPLRYSLFGINQHGRSAGPSNVVMVLAGEAPPPVENLSLQVVERGVVLHWQPVSNLAVGTAIQIDRTLILATMPAKTTATKNASLLPRTVESEHQELRVNLNPAGNEKPSALADPGIALDTSALFGRHYSYTVSRVVQRQVDAQTVQVASAPSRSADITTVDTFPPRAPSRLVAIPVSPAINNGHAEVDLSWSANTEPDLAKYRVYRQDVLSKRIDAADCPRARRPFRRCPHVPRSACQPGHTYAYAVTAVDASGNESLRGRNPMEVTVPAS